jgi:hypothetical protein
MKKIVALFFCGFMIMACQMLIPGTKEIPTDDTIIIKAATISPLREIVAKTPAAQYIEQVPDTLNDWKFAAALYETKRTFVYDLRVQYKELRITDSIKIPNFGMLPKVGIQKGKEPLSCILGFEDKKGVFKPYRKVQVKGDQLKISTLNTYYVGAYQTQVSK